MSNTETKIQPILDWISEIPIVKYTTNLKTNANSAIFGGLLRHLVLRADDPFEEQKQAVIQYFEDGGDIDVIYDDDLDDDLGKLMIQTPSQNGSKYEIYRHNQKMQQKRLTINRKQKIQINSVEHNNNGYLSRHMSKNKFHHFHTKLRGKFKDAPDSPDIPITIDMTNYKPIDFTMALLHYDFSVNMLATKWNQKTNKWDLWSRHPKHEVETIMGDIKKRQYQIVGGPKHVGSYRYFAMARRGFYPLKTHESIFIENVFNPTIDDKTQIASVLDHIFENIKDTLMDIVKTQKKPLTGWFASWLIACLNDPDTDTNSNDKINERTIHFIQLFGENPVVDSIQFAYIWQETSLEQFKQLDQLIEFDYNVIHYYRPLIFEHAEDVESVKFIAEKIGNPTIDDFESICVSQSTPVLKMIVEEYLSDQINQINWSKVMQNAIFSNNSYLLEYITIKCPEEKFRLTVPSLGREFDHETIEFIFQHCGSEFIIQNLYNVIRQLPISSQMIQLIIELDINQMSEFHEFVVEKIIEKGLKEIHDGDSENRIIGAFEHIYTWIPKYSKFVDHTLRSSNHPLAWNIRNKVLGHPI